MGIRNATALLKRQPERGIMARYRKFIIAALVAAGIAGLQGFQDGGLSTADIWSIIIAGAGALGVVVTPNALPHDEAVNYLRNLQGLRDDIR